MEFVVVLVLWALVGWCGTVNPRPRPIPPPPPPPPWRLAAAMIAGVVLGYVTYWVLGLSMPLSSMDFIATSLGAFVGGVVCWDVTERFTARSS